MIPPFFRLLIDDRMFTCKKIRNGSTYLGTHLSANDYYCEQEQVTGVWLGKGAERLAIAGQTIEMEDAAFEALPAQPASGWFWPADTSKGGELDSVL